MSLLVRLLALAFFLVFSSSGSSKAESLSTGRSEARPVGSSEILLARYEWKEDSASEFLSQRLLELEELIKELEDAEVKEFDQVLRESVSKTLDLQSLGKRAMLRYWDELGKTEVGQRQRKQYLKLFKQLVEESYLEQARRFSEGDHQIELEEEASRGEFQIVKGSIERPDVDVIVEFQLKQNSDEWKVQDIRLDSTSLEATYRSSFSRIIRRKGGLEEGFPHLISVMERRLHDLRVGEATRL